MSQSVLDIFGQSIIWLWILALCLNTLVDRGVQQAETPRPVAVMFYGNSILMNLPRLK